PGVSLEAEAVIAVPGVAANLLTDLHGRNVVAEAVLLLVRLAAQQAAGKGVAGRQVVLRARIAFLFADGLVLGRQWRDDVAPATVPAPCDLDAAAGGLARLGGDEAVLVVEDHRLLAGRAGARAKAHIIPAGGGRPNPGGGLTTRSRAGRFPGERWPRCDH